GNGKCCGGSMSDGWVRCRLSDAIALQRGFDLPERSRRPGDVPVLGSCGVTGAHDVAKASGPGGTIGRSGGAVGVATYTTQDYWPLNTTLYVTDFRGNDPRFVYFLLRATDFGAYNSGSAQPSLNRNHIARLPVVLPPAAEQRAIAATLGSLDDKIEGNERIAAAGERLLRASYARLGLAVAGVARDPLRLGDLLANVRLPVSPADLPPATPYVGLEHMPRGSVLVRECGVAGQVTSIKSAFDRHDIL